MLTATVNQQESGHRDADAVASINAELSSFAERMEDLERRAGNRRANGPR